MPRHSSGTIRPIAVEQRQLNGKDVSIPAIQYSPGRDARNFRGFC
jgi:hypothetical protein